MEHVYQNEDGTIRVFSQSKRTSRACKDAGLLNKWEAKKLQRKNKKNKSKKNHQL